MLELRFKAGGGLGYKAGKTFWTEFKEAREGGFSELLWWGVELFLNHEKSGKGGSRPGPFCRKGKENTE